MGAAVPIPPSGKDTGASVNPVGMRQVSAGTAGARTCGPADRSREAPRSSPLRALGRVVADQVERELHVLLGDLLGTGRA